MGYICDRHYTVGGTELCEGALNSVRYGIKLLPSDIQRHKFVRLVSGKKEDGTNIEILLLEGSYLALGIQGNGNNVLFVWSQTMGHIEHVLQLFYKEVGDKIDREKLVRGLNYD